MSRSSYSDDCDYWPLIQWRGAVTSAIRGKRGQGFLYEMLHAMAALPERKLITDALEHEGAFCALGAVGHSRGIDMSGVDPDDSDAVAALFGIPRALACEIVFMNDEGYYGADPEKRFSFMREWVESNLLVEKP